MAAELQNSDKIKEELIHTNHNTETDIIIKSFCSIFGRQTHGKGKQKSNNQYYCKIMKSNNQWSPTLMKEA